MFWRRKKAAVEETDDLLKMQKQFGITLVNDADVQIEFEALFGAGSSQRVDEHLLYEAQNAVEDEEATMLRDLEMEKDTEGEDHNHSELHHNVRELLKEDCKTVNKSHWREVAEMNESGGMIASSSNRHVQVLEMEAMTRERNGSNQDAMGKLCEATQLQEKLSTLKLESMQKDDNKLEHNVARVIEIVADTSDDDVGVTDRDMQDSEFLAQLADMRFTEDSKDDSDAEVVNVVQELHSLDEKVRELKRQALEYKRKNQLADALACMRKIKELEAKRDEVQLVPVTSPQATQKRTSLEPIKPVNDITLNDALSVMPMDLDAVPFDKTYPEGNNDNVNDAESFSEDMNKSVCTVKVPKARSEDVASFEFMQTDIRASPNMMQERKTVANSRYLKNAPSIDEDFLIDAFDSKSDSDEKINHHTSVMSSAPLHVPSSSPEARDIAPPAEHEHTKVKSLDAFSDLSTELQKARRTALTMKRKGNIQSALEAMRRAKQIQSLIDHKQQASEKLASTVVGSLHNAAKAAKFQEIEKLLVNFGNRMMMLAKKNLSVNREKASRYLSRRKRYEAELEKLRLKRQNPLQLPPHYEIVKVSYNVVVELPFVQDDQIMVCVKSVNGLSQMAGKSVFVKFCLNFPSETSHKGQTAEFQISSNASFSTNVPVNLSSFVYKLARSRGTMRLFEIKKAVFEVWKPATMFRNPELVARAYHQLAPLLTCCEINTHIPFVGPNRKPCEGDIEIVLQVRRPLKEKEVRLETVEELVIRDYPEPMTSSLKHMSVSGVVLEQSSASSQDVDTIDPKVTLDHQSAAPKEDQPSCALAVSDDPYHLDLIVSYDVINEELAKVAAKLPSLTGRTAIEWSDRYDALALKKQLLEIEMQTGKLTLEMYVERLQIRISADRVLMSQLLTSNRRLDAAQVLRRVKLMEKELEGTADGSSDV